MRCSQFIDRLRASPDRNTLGLTQNDDHSVISLARGEGNIFLALGFRFLALGVDNIAVAKLVGPSDTRSQARRAGPSDATAIQALPSDADGRAISNVEFSF